MLNKLERFIRQHRLIGSGDRVICAVSGGADSMALLMGLYLLREKLGFSLEAAHFNHGLRGVESDEDESFVREFCQGLDIPCHCGSGTVIPGKKGLEAAAREARYSYLTALGGNAVYLLFAYARPALYHQRRAEICRKRSARRAWCALSPFGVFG